MRFNKLINKLQKSSKTPAEYMEEEELASPYEDIDFNKMSQAMEKGISTQELSDIIKKKRKMKEMAERLRMKQER